MAVYFPETDTWKLAEELTDKYIQDQQQNPPSDFDDESSSDDSGSSDDSDGSSTPVPKSSAEKGKRPAKRKVSFMHARKWRN